MQNISAVEAASIAAMLYSPNCVVQVGSTQLFSGPGNALQAQVREALAIDSASDMSATLPNEQGSGWHHVAACVAGAPGQCAVVRANTPRVSALLSEEAFRSVWPHARALRTELHDATTVDKVLVDSGVSLPPDWLLVECHPAGEVLRGATSLLRSIHVLWVAVALELPPFWPADAALAEVDAMAQRAGLKRLWAGSGLNPSLGHALYIRDPAALVEQLSNAERGLSEIANLMGHEKLEHAQTSDALAQSRLALAQSEAALKESNHALAQTKETLAQTSEFLAQSRQALAHSNEALASIRAERAILDDHLALARLENASLVERAALVEMLEAQSLLQAQELEAMRLEILQHVMDLESLREERAELAAGVAEVANLKEAVRVLEEEKAARRTSALEDFRLARLHAQKEQERQHVHERTAMKANEMESRLASLHQLMALASSQLDSLKQLTCS